MWERGKEEEGYRNTLDTLLTGELRKKTYPHNLLADDPYKQIESGFHNVPGPPYYDYGGWGGIGDDQDSSLGDWKEEGEREADVSQPGTRDTNFGAWKPGRGYDKKEGQAGRGTRKKQEEVTYTDYDYARLDAERGKAAGGHTEILDEPEGSGGEESEYDYDIYMEYYEERGEPYRQYMDYYNIVEDEKESNREEGGREIEHTTDVATPMLTQMKIFSSSTSSSIQQGDVQTQDKRQQSTKVKVDDRTTEKVKEEEREEHEEEEDEEEEEEKEEEEERKSLILNPGESDYPHNSYR